MQKVENIDVSPTFGNTVLPAVVGSQTKYQIVYADPAWDFGNRMYSSNKNDHHREIERAYSVMKTKDICELPIKNITADDCVCFMWTTDAHIPDAI